MLVLPTQENLCAHSPMASMDDLKMSAHSEKARRRRRPGGPPLADVDGQDPDSWKSAVQGVLGEIRASSPTLQTFREHGLRLRESYDALRRAVQRARRQRVPQNSRGSGQQTLSTDLNRLLKDVGSKKRVKPVCRGCFGVWSRPLHRGRCTLASASLFPALLGHLPALARIHLLEAEMGILLAGLLLREPGLLSQQLACIML